MAPLGSGLLVSRSPLCARARALTRQTDSDHLQDSLTTSTLKTTQTSRLTRPVDLPAAALHMRAEPARALTRLLAYWKRGVGGTATRPGPSASVPSRGSVELRSREAWPPWIAMLVLGVVGEGGG